MNSRKLACSLLATGALFGSAISTVAAQDDTADILVQVLVKKGILTEAEAFEIRHEVATVAAQQKADIVETAVSQSASPAGSSDAYRYVPMPSKLGGLKLFGDARFRYQYENAKKIRSDDNKDRSRWRYRARFGAEYDFLESGFSMGTRIETSSSNDSTNANFGNVFDKSGGGLYIGRLYLDYEGEDWSLTLGKQGSPFTLPKAIWDSDLNPEGVTERFKFGGTNITLGQYIVDEEDERGQVVGGPRVEDDFLFMAQADLEVGGVSYSPFAMVSTGGLSTDSENGAFRGENANNYFHNLLVLGVPFEYGFKLGQEKAKVFGSYGVNLEGDDAINDPNSPYYAGTTNNSSQNQFFNLGLQLGSGKKAGESKWSLEYRYIEATSMSPNFTDSDFGKGHTNQEGFVFNYTYALTDFLKSSITYMNSQAIDEGYLGKAGDNGDVQLVQVDAAVKF